MELKIYLSNLFLILLDFAFSGVGWWLLCLWEWAFVFWVSVFVEMEPTAGVLAFHRWIPALGRSFRIFQGAFQGYLLLERFERSLRTFQRGLFKGMTADAGVKKEGLVEGIGGGVFRDVRFHGYDGGGLSGIPVFTGMTGVEGIGGGLGFISSESGRIVERDRQGFGCVVVPASRH